MVLVLMMMRWFNTTAVGIGGDDRGMFGRRWCRCVGGLKVKICAQVEISGLL